MKNLFLPKTDQPLLLPPHSIKTREKPSMITFRGMDLYYSFDQSHSKIWISYRVAHSDEKGRHIKNYGPVVLKEAYTVNCKTSEKKDEEIARETIKRVFDRFFVPKLLQYHPSIYSATTRFDIAANLAIQKLEMLEHKSKVDDAALSDLISLFASKRIEELLPSECAPIIIDNLSHTKSKNCLTLLRKLFVFAWSPMVPEISILWENYRVPRIRNSYDPKRTVRDNFYGLPLNLFQTTLVLERCIRAVHDNNERFKNRYLAAAIMLMLHITPEELCALNIDSAQRLANYSSIVCIRITQYQRIVGKNKSLTDYGVKRLRERKYH